jgi:hypothetical protein
MWKYNNQILIRWVSFITVFLLVTTLLLVASREFPEGLGKPQIKALATRLAISIEFAPWYFWLLTMVLFTVIMLIGVPTILIFSSLYVVVNFEIALLVSLAGQFMTGILAVHLARRRNSTEKIPVYLKKRLASADISPAQLAFWGRLYLSYPMRTIDFLTASVMNEDQKLSSLYPAIAAGTLLRNIFPFAWAAALIVIIRNYSPTPVKDASSMLVRSSLLLVQIILPKIPELLICPRQLRPVLAQIESWDKPLQGSLTDKRARSKIKLGMQPRPN